MTVPDAGAAFPRVSVNLGTNTRPGDSNGRRGDRVDGTYVANGLRTGITERPKRR